MKFKEFYKNRAKFIKFIKLRVTLVNLRSLYKALDRVLFRALHEALHEVLRSQALRNKTKH